MVESTYTQHLPDYVEQSRKWPLLMTNEANRILPDTTLKISTVAPPKA